MKKYFLCVLSYLMVTNVNCTDIIHKVEEVAEKLPQAKITENIIYVKPDMQIYLPNGAIDLKFKETYRNSVISFASKYDFVDSFMGFDLDLGYGFKPLLGVNLHDKVDFSEIFAKQETMYRSQSITPYAKLQLSQTSQLNFFLGFENTLITSAETSVKVEHGKNIMNKIIFINNTIKENNISDSKKGRNITLQIRHSVKPLGSDYDYANAEIYLMGYLPLVKNQVLEYKLNIGYPLYSTRKPLSELYYLGGYKLLKGYKYKEFSSEAMGYSEIKYNIPLTKVTNLNFLGITLAIITWNVFFETANIGDSKIFHTIPNMKSSIGTGIDCNLTIFKILPIKINFTVAQAFERRLPQLHCTIATTYYTWKTE
ncbi:MAG: outer membrane protein assembly factor [Endomicrobia bacterium]|nr:outer membrane protein assembly factor [Endomicrobiia bacterium]